MIYGNGPKPPKFPLALIHPRGPIFRLLPVRLRRHLLFFIGHRTWGNFTLPRTWSEKLQWRVLNDLRPLLQVGADKLASKEYARSVIKEHGLTERVKIPETYWVGTDLNELRAIADQLPPRWVLKPNHTSGRFMLIDATNHPVNWEAIMKIAATWILPDEQEYMLGHELYARARHLLFAEERVGDGPQAPHDMRILAFSGEGRPTNVFQLQSAFRTAEGEITHRYSKDFVRVIAHALDAPLDVRSPIDEMPQGDRETFVTFGRLAAQPFDHVRVDLYFVRGIFWFGEMAVYPASGLSTFTAEQEAARSLAWELPDLTVPDPREGEWRALLEGVPKGTLQARIAPDTPHA